MLLLHYSNVKKTPGQLSAYNSASLANQTFGDSHGSQNRRRSSRSSNSHRTSFALRMQVLHAS